MVKFTLILLQIIFAASAALAEEKDEGKEFIYIGSFPSNSQNNYDMNNYYVSQNPTIWSSADLDCTNILGPNSGLVAIDTLAEWEFLKLALEQHGFGTSYWTSGMWDPTVGVWRWVLNHLPIVWDPPWAPGQPNDPITNVHRILIYHNSRYDANWRTAPHSQSHRYVCEMRTPQC